MHRALKIAIAALVVALAVGGVFWVSRDTPKSDCDIAADMMTYRKTVGDEISAVKDKSDGMEDPNGFILSKYDEWETEVPKYVDQIKNPDIRSRAQAVSDSDGPLIEWHKGMMANPPDFSDLAWRASNDAKLKQLTDRITETSKALQQVCPNIQSYNTKKSPQASRLGPAQGLGFHRYPPP